MPPADGRGGAPPAPTHPEGLLGRLPSPVADGGLIPSVKNPNRVTASRPLLSQPVLAGFSNVCRCLLPAQPHPSAGPAVRPASFGTRAASRLQLNKRRFAVQAPSALHSAPKPRCKVGQFRARFASDFSLPRFEVPLLPTLLPPGAACPGELAVRSSVQSSSPTMLLRGVLLAVQGKPGLGGYPRGALSQPSPHPAALVVQLAVLGWAI